ncbi:hypothetical protein ACHAXR_001989 [Thalassiosira sp. AJA248-18]
MRNRTERQMIEAYNKIVKKMKAGVLGIKLHILDNEISADYKEAIKNNGVTHQLVPLGDHRQNMAERGQSKPSKTISLVCWQACATLFRCIYVAASSNQLKSNITPKISAYAHLHGHHNFMKQPLAPLGFPVLAHEKPDKRGTWSDHAIDAWNLGTSMEHHRCFKIYSKITRAERIADTLFLKHKYLTSPTVTPEDAVIAAAQQFTRAISGNSNGENKAMAALKEVAKIFEDIANDNKKKATTTTHKNSNI